MWEYCTFDCDTLDVAKFTTLTPLSLLILCKHSFPAIGLKTSSLSTLARTFKRIVKWYLT
jgi:hypothetical protein